MNNKNIPQNNFIKKIFRRIKENFMSDDIKNEIKIELLDPLFIGIKNFILPHYVIFIVFFLIIIIIELYLISIVKSIENKIR